MPDLNENAEHRDTQLRVTVVYALPDEQHLVRLLLPPDATVIDAASRSGLLQRFPHLAVHSLQCAVFNKPVTGTHRLTDGDRIDILRPLQVDPKEQRRREAARMRAARAKRS